MCLVEEVRLHFHTDFYCLNRLLSLDEKWWGLASCGKAQHGFRFPVILSFSQIVFSTFKNARMFQFCGNPQGQGTLLSGEVVTRDAVLVWVKPLRQEDLLCRVLLAEETLSTS